ncbi:hypothetical protein MY3296_000609 [Beauveria thailandica]
MALSSLLSLRPRPTQLLTYHEAGGTMSTS